MSEGRFVILRGVIPTFSPKALGEARGLRATLLLPGLQEVQGKGEGG